MESSASSWLVSITEPSADQLAAPLLEYLFQQGISLHGLAGHMSSQFFQQEILSQKEMNVMGIFEIIKHIPHFWTMRKRMDEAAKHTQLFLGIDAPDWNIRLAKMFYQKRRLPCIQWVCPSVWAWRRYRLYDLKAYFKEIWCLFPFEKDFLHQYDIEVFCTGHPVVHQFPAKPKEYDERSKTLLLMPGSRRQEWQQHMPVLLAAAQAWQESFPDWRIELVLAKQEHLQWWESFCQMQANPPRIYPVIANSHQQLQQARLAWVCSGTATLEAWLAGCPQVVCYRMHPMTFAIARRLVRLKQVSLPNLLTGSSLCPELIQDRFSVASLLIQSELVTEKAYIHQYFEQAMIWHKRLQPVSPNILAQRMMRMVS